MAKGATSKNIFFNKLLEVFPGSFMYNDGKEVRIPFQEDGQEVQLKITATCAKENVIQGADNAIPGVAFDATKVTINEGEEPTFEKMEIEPSQEELDTVNDLVKALGLQS